MDIFTRLTAKKEDLPVLSEQELQELEQVCDDFEASYCYVCNGECCE